MPSCNLAETKHNAWLQESSNRGNDFYVATVNDFVRALIQVSRYYQFIKGDYVGTSPGKEELMLLVTQHSTLQSGNPKALNVATAKMPGAEEFCTREPHFEGAEVFGSQKRKADISLRSEHESHRPDQVNFSCPQVRTRSTAAAGASCSLSDILEEPSTALQEHPIPNVNSRTIHVTTIHKTACKETEWYITRLPKTSAKACFAQQASTKKNCKVKIMQGNTATAAPTYTGVMEHHQKKTDKVMKFFYNDDIERCTKGTKRRWVKSRPDVPNVWPVKIGTNLSRKEILDLEHVGF
jgi:hypothetical protein